MAHLDSGQPTDVLCVLLPDRTELLCFARISAPRLCDSAVVCCLSSLRSRRLWHLLWPRLGRSAQSESALFAVCGDRKARLSGCLRLRMPLRSNCSSSCGWFARALHHCSENGANVRLRKRCMWSCGAGRRLLRGRIGTRLVGSWRCRLCGCCSCGVRRCSACMRGLSRHRSVLAPWETCAGWESAR